jgi:hypothetical protein
MHNASPGSMQPVIVWDEQFNTSSQIRAGEECEKILPPFIENDISALS